MAGPTPVSALIHAATMVTAGVYSVVRSNAIYQFSPTAMWIVAVIGAATALSQQQLLSGKTTSKSPCLFDRFAAWFHVPRGWCRSICRSDFHVMTPRLFQALLFLGSGSVIHGMHHEQDMRKMGGLKKHMPITFITMAAGWLAICGIIPFAGFFSKDEILYKTFAADRYFPAGVFPGEEFLWGVAAITAVLTAIYMTRMMVMTFWGSERFHDALPGEEHHEDAHDDHADAHADDDEEHHHALPHDFKPHESPWVMTVPLIILAFLSTVGGLVGVPYAMSSLIGIKDANAFEHVLEPVVADNEMETAIAAKEMLKLTNRRLCKRAYTRGLSL